MNTQEVNINEEQIQIEATVENLLNEIISKQSTIEKRLKALYQ